MKPCYTTGTKKVIPMGRLICRFRRAYFVTKSLKKTLNLDLNMYLAKKLLWKPTILTTNYKATGMNTFLLKVLIHL